MLTRRRCLALLVGGILLAGARGAFAQAPPPYVRLDFSSDLEESLKRQLLLAKEGELVRQWFEFVKQHPEKFKQPDGAPKLNLPNDPAFRQQVKKWLDEQPPGLKPSADEIKALQKKVVSQIYSPGPGTVHDVTQPPGNSNQPAGKADASAQQPKLDVPPQAPDPPPEWLQHFMEKIENSGLAEKLSQSPAWREARLDLERMGLGSTSKSFFGSERLKGLAKELGSFTDKKLALPDLPRPNLGSFKPPPLPEMPRPKLHLGGLPSFGTFGPRGPGLPSSANLSNLAPALVVLVFVGLGAWLLWSVAGRAGFSLRRPKLAGPTLGPWPVDPAQLATKADLVRCFDYLAVLVLGESARPWHHRAVAGGLGAASEDKRRAADHLALLYEQARYAPGDEPLDSQALESARRDLCFLAGVSQA